MQSRIISQRELAARWSYAEVTGRFANEYIGRFQNSESIALIAKIAGATPFDILDAAEKERLSVWFETGYRKDYANAFNGWYKSFQCETWTKSQLARVHTLPVIDPLEQRRSLAFLSYLAHPRKRLPNGDIDIRDPAVAADSVPIATPFVQKEPLVIGHWDDGKLTLWEGNFRAVLFARTSDPKAEVLVWMPHEGNWPGKNAV
jgi:hypothetical protein